MLLVLDTLKACPSACPAFLSRAHCCLVVQNLQCKSPLCLFLTTLPACSLTHDPPHRHNRVLPFPSQRTTLVALMVIADCQ